METAPRIEFDGLERPEKVREDVAGYVAGLENRFGRITACHVVVRSPGEHHRSGGLYEVNIRLALPDGRAQRLRKLVDKSWQQIDDSRRMVAMAARVLQ
jgi:hypothetical protein